VAALRCTQPREETMKGLVVNIYRHNGANCSNGGLSATHDKAVLTGDGIPDIFQPTDDAPEVRLYPAHIGDGFRVVPVKNPMDRRKGPMFGGAFVY
jgi:hypothetical protein